MECLQVPHIPILEGIFAPQNKGNMGKYFRLTNLLTLLLLLAGCSSTRNMRVLTARPANIPIERSIKRIAIINRAIPLQKSIIEGVITGELPGTDVKLSRECISALNQELGTSNRFTTTVYNRELLSGSLNSTEFGPYLSWNTISEICKKTEADAVLSLEYFDAGYTLENLAKASKTIDKVLTNNTGEPIFSANGTASAKAGFRIYNNHNQSVIYENGYRHNRVWKQTARTYLEAAAKLLKRNEAIVCVSRELGSSFSRQLIPMSYWEDRLMFKGKNPLSVKAERLALTRNWEAAADTWKQAFDQAVKPKERGAIAYNLALANEVLGNYELAKKWIVTSYTEGGDRRALEYSKIIDGLIYDNQRMQQ